MSGQAVNYGKSSVVFSRNTSLQNRGLVCDRLQVRETSKLEKYLGMPMCAGSNKREVFDFLVNRVGHKLQGWANKSLSRAGKLTLLKSAAQVVPNFWMSLFLLPGSVCNDIEKLMNGFWWGGGVNEKGIRWLWWDKISVVKSNGGLGLKQLRTFNIAMLAKQVWRILNNSNPLVTVILKARYFSNTIFLNAGLGVNPSYV